ncbi:sialate O-acetylesterase [Spirosoma rhododendri]|uniref:DUF11 domain-containing protein n=1 Tax=Spirosoma rhododendri TaxID=2728024 RepID=A0A7L5DKQ1_9BACT|nr:sialate O-acetylesterase [Spirosoma rhododendri]QJD79006.1 DUF11 domain-containing protein [Spirosoma rhododendri]
MGIGEVFAIAGQSNGQGIENRDAVGASDQRVVCVPHLNKTDTVSMPLPMYSQRVSATSVIGPRGLTGWCWSRLGDRLAARLNVPVAFMNSAWSGTAVRNWRESISADSTATSYNEYFRPGMPYGNLKRIVQDYMPLTGLRAVLWHQGESEFYDTDPSAANYFNDLQTVIRQCRQDAGYDMAWVVARASMDNNLYANYGLTHYEPVVSAQNRVVQQVPAVFYGPDTDVIQMPRTDGVHFSGNGLIQVGDAWNDFLNDDFFRNASPRLPQPIDVADLHLSLLVDRPTTESNRPVTVTIVATNEGAKTATNVRIRCALPTGLSYVTGGESIYQRGMVFSKIGSINPSESKQIQFQVSPTREGTYVLAGEIVRVSQIDTDSRPNTSTGDGQDDMATVQFRAGSGPVYTMPVSINADPLPSVASNQPTPVADQADLSLAMVADRTAMAVGSPVSLSLVVSNRGGLVSGRVQVGCQLPDGLTFLDGSGVQLSGATVRGTTVTIAAGSYDTISFRVLPTKAGLVIPQAQIESAGGVADPDSTPNNGFTNGEDDCSQLSLRAN